MNRKRSWTEVQLKEAVRGSTSYRQVLVKLNLRDAGGNYSQIKKYIKEYGLNIKHFKGKAWNKGLTGIGKPRVPLDKILVKGTYFHSFQLKKTFYC